MALTFEPIDIPLNFALSCTWFWLFFMVHGFDVIMCDLCIWPFDFFSPIDTCVRWNQPWQPLAFVPLLTSLLLTKVDISYTETLHDEKILGKIKVIGSINMKYMYVPIFSEIWVKTGSKISLNNTRLPHGKNCLSWWSTLGNSWTGSKPSGRSIIAAKWWEKNTCKKERWKKALRPWSLSCSSQSFDFCACPSKNAE